MFERYTEKARRVIFFARYEASRYGSTYIDTEHLLLGLLREDGALMTRVLGTRGNASEIRREIEKGITVRERISTSVEVPLTQECKRILCFASDESTQLGHGYVGTEHLLLGILMASGSIAARILTDRGVNLDAVRQQVERPRVTEEARLWMKSSEEAKALLDAFLTSVTSNKWVEVASYFAADVQFVDSTGKRWKGYQEIEKQFDALFVPYAKRDVTHTLEDFDIVATDMLIASVLWENVTIRGQLTRSMQRMTLIFATVRKDWAIYFLQVTPVKVP